ncbi:MAG: flagellar protein FlgN [Hahellaceae bacterium]|nr:flagellar protein FlgN [Hahellaceae bacterium]
MTADLKVFIDLLKHDLETLALLERLLSEERMALESRDLRALQTLTPEKNTLLDTMAENTRQRIAWLDSTGMGKSRFLELIKAKAASVHALYTRAESELVRIKQMNEVNGRILIRTQQVNERLMDIIRGKGHLTADLYAANGQKTSSDGSAHSLALA